jgi:hypothetical protein
MKLSALAHVRAENETLAPGCSVAPRLARKRLVEKTNEINSALNMVATITDVFFSVEEGAPGSQKSMVREYNGLSSALKDMTVFPIP